MHCTSFGSRRSSTAVHSTGASPSRSCAAWERGRQRPSRSGRCGRGLGRPGQLRAVPRRRAAARGPARLRLHGRAGLQHRSRARAVRRAARDLRGFRARVARTRPPQALHHDLRSRTRARRRNARGGRDGGRQHRRRHRGCGGLGLRAVLVDRHGRYPEHPGERITGLDELPPLLGLGLTAATPPAGT